MDVKPGAELVSTAENKRDGNLAGSAERGAESSDEALTRKIFGLALAIATEPSTLGQVRQMLVQLQEQRGLPEGFSTWALGRIDERVMAMALAYADDAEVLVQLLSFKGGTFAVSGRIWKTSTSTRRFLSASLLQRSSCCGHMNRRSESSQFVLPEDASRVCGR
jgi:hypothetical protein